VTDRLKLPWAIGAPLTSPSRRLFLSPVGTPRNRDNMIAWIAARSDFPGYGEMIVYKLSKDYLILGPLQIKATIDQDTTISRQLTLWDQRGSRVIRGNLLVIPINQSFLYVEPVFLIAEGTNISAAQAGHRQRRQPPSDGIDARGGSPSHFRRATVDPGRNDGGSASAYIRATRGAVEGRPGAPAGRLDRIRACVGATEKSFGGEVT
jgi:hypothetical protein